MLKRFCKTLTALGREPHKSRWFYGRALFKQGVGLPMLGRLSRGERVSEKAL